MAGEIEEELFAENEVTKAMSVAHVGNVHLHAIANAFDVVKITAVVRDQALDDGYLGTELDKAARQIQSNEAETPGNKNSGAGEFHSSWRIVAHPLWLDNVFAVGNWPGRCSMQRTR